ncbi:hypothetical protein GCM10009864_06720 [Streptomyces lunalinharesii]|uniref:Uncharacterized protein n=1 Tax=Streptomyces lunalinharesii TaxID=333384 RepID=A0ABP6DPS4_9ACTN
MGQGFRNNGHYLRGGGRIITQHCMIPVHKSPIPADVRDASTLVPGDINNRITRTVTLGAVPACPASKIASRLVGLSRKRSPKDGMYTHKPVAECDKGRSTPEE